MGVVGVSLSAFLFATLSAASTAAQILGANYNERPRDVDGELLTASETPWTRGFLDVFDKENNGNPLSDSDVVGLRRAADAGQELLVSFKWDFKGAGERVPAPGSAREAELFDEAVLLLQAINRPVNSIVLGNEPMFETPNADLEFDGGEVPYVRFTERLLDHVRAEFGDQQALEPRYFVGSLNRLDQGSNQSRDVVQELFRVARDNPAIAGMDLHTHFETLAQADAMMGFARQELGASNKDLIVTEFSPVWRYQAALDDPVGGAPEGVAFAQQYGYSSTLQVDEYLQNAFDNQVSRAEWTDFIESQPWYNEDHLEDMHALFRQHDVSIATLGFSQPLSMRGMNVTRDGYRPFHINWLYIHALVDEGSFLESYNERYREDWLALQADLADINRDGAIDLDDYDLIKAAFGEVATPSTFTGSLQAGDLNLDWNVDHDDLKRFFASHAVATGLLIGDLDGDGDVDGDDWPILLQNLGRDVGDPLNAWAEGDFDDSGRVDARDFRLFKDSFIATHGAESFASLVVVPEPSTLGLCSVGLMALANPRSRNRSAAHESDWISSPGKNRRPTIVSGERVLAKRTDP